MRWVHRFNTENTVQTRLRVLEERSPQQNKRHAVLAAFELNPRLSVRQVARQLGISKSFVWRVIRQQMYPFKPQVLFELQPDDYERRKQFCVNELGRISSNRNHLPFLLFTDEAIFHLDGHVNKQNTRCWSETNPHWIIEEAVQSPKVVVWCGLWREGVVGPFFFEGTVTGDAYLRMLEQYVLPELEASHMQREVCIFQQDGAPPHYATTVRDWLDRTFPGNWMGRGSPTMPWPPRSPDLTICDFFVWGFVKAQVYAVRVRTKTELKERILSAFDAITDTMREAAFRDYERRLHKCLQVRGGHVD